MKTGIIWNRLRKKNIIAGEVKVEKSEQEKVLRYSFLLSFPWNLFNTPHHWKVVGGNLRQKLKYFPCLGHLSWWVWRKQRKANTRSCCWERGVQKDPGGTLAAAGAKRLLGCWDIYPHSYHHAQCRNPFPSPLVCIKAWSLPWDMKCYLETEPQLLPLKCQSGPQSPASYSHSPMQCPLGPVNSYSFFKTPAKCHLLCEVYQI